jgi:hypothetical protein
VSNEERISFAIDSRVANLALDDEEAQLNRFPAFEVCHRQGSQKTWSESLALRTHQQVHPLQDAKQ